ncbi:MAG: type II secretion system protein GspG [Opitutales bacterium]|nr:type II secretion system protein GspG [Opitutales bacterium]
MSGYESSTAMIENIKSITFPHALLICFFIHVLHSQALAEQPQFSPLSQRSQRQISDAELHAISDLYIAVEEGNLKAVSKCLEAGTNIDCVLGKLSYRVLHKAARDGTTEMVSFLIKRGADVNARAEYGWTPLDLATKKDRPEIIKLIRENGGKTDIELTDKNSVRSLKMSLNIYKLDVGHYPTMQEGGLSALFKKPVFKDRSLQEIWKGPYIKGEKAMVDEWGRRLNYEPTKREYKLFSSGPDGKPGNKDDIICARSFDYSLRDEN